jgi:PTS system mannitol-specific IIA component
MIAVRVAESAVDRMAAIHRCADVLEQMRSVDPAYRAAMLAQERLTSTYLGAGVAVPHGQNLLVRRDAVAVLRFPDGVDWAGRRVFLCVAIAAGSDGQHVETLAAVAEILLDPIRAAALRAADDPDEIIRLFCR